MNTAYLLLIASLLVFEVSSEGLNSHSGDHPDSHSEYHNEDGDKWHDQRELKLEHDETSIHFFSRNPLTGDRIKFHMLCDGDSPMRFSMFYFPTNQSVASVVRSHVEFGSVVEFTETKTPFDGFDANDTVRSRLILIREGWGKITGPAVTAITGGHLYNFSVSYKGIVTLMVVLADVPYQLGTDQYEPGQVKIDVHIDNYNYTTDGTYLGLECFVQSPRLFSEQKGIDEDEIRTFVSDVSMAFGWKRTILADGVSANVVTTGFQAVPEAGQHDEEGDGTFWKHETVFAFDAVKPTHIAWDPVIGVQSGAPAITALLAIAVALLKVFSQ